MGFTSLEITNDGHSIKILRGASVIPEYYHLHDVIGHRSHTIDFTTSVDPLDDLSSMRKGELYPYPTMLRVYIFMRGRSFRADRPLYFDIQDVTNQPTWTHDQSGLEKALEDINGWVPSYINPITLDSNTLSLEADEANLSLRTAAQFTAANSEKLTNTSTDFQLGDNDFTIFGWGYQDVVSGNSTIISKWQASGSQKGFYVAFNSSTSIEFRMSVDGGTEKSIFYSIAAATTSTWYFVVAVYDSVNDLMKLSVNGSTFTTASLVGGMHPSTESLQLGGFGSGNHLTGRVDSIGIYNKALSQAEVTTLYNSGAGQNYNDIDKTDLLAYWALNETSGTRFDSHGGYHLTDNNTVTYEDGIVLDSGIDEYKLGFSSGLDEANSEGMKDASNSDALKCVGDEDKTYIIWFAADLSDATTRHLMGCYGATTDRGFTIYLYNGSIRCSISGDGTSSEYNSLISTTTPSHGAGWNMIAIVHDGVNDLLKMSVNGAAFDEVAHTYGGFNTIEEFRIAAGSGFGGTFDGDTDYASIWNTAMSLADIQKHYNGGLGLRVGLWENSGFTLTDCVALWEMNENSGQPRLDYFGNYDLTSIGSISSNFGVVYSAKKTTYDISYWNDLSGNGNHFEQGSTAARPIYDGTKLSFDGVAEFLECINGSTPFESDNVGEFIIVGSKSNLAKQGVGLSVGDIASAGNNSFITHERSGAANLPNGLKAQFQGVNTGYTATDPVGTDLILNVSTEGTRIRMGINNVDVPITSASTLWWNATVSPTDTFIGKIVSTAGTFQEGDVYAIYYFDEELTTEQREGVMAYINNKYSVYTELDTFAKVLTAIPDMKIYHKYDLSNDFELTPSPTSILVADYNGDAASSLFDGLNRAVSSTQYESDWSVDVDGWNISVNNVTTAFGQSIGGVDNCLKVTCTGGSATHSVRKGGVFLGNSGMNVKVGIYIPSTNTNIDGIQLSASGAIGDNLFYNSLAPDTWHYFDHNKTFGSTGTLQSILLLRDGESLASVNCDGDEVYISYINTYELDTKVVKANTLSAQPTIDTTAETLDFDGVSEYLESPDLFTEISGDTQGFFILEFDDDEGTGVDNFIVDVNDGIPTPSNNIIWGLEGSADKAFLIYQGNAVHFEPVTRGGNVEITLLSDGAGYFGFDGYKEMVITNAPTNNGNWIGDNGALTTLEVGFARPTTYSAFGLKRIIYGSTKPTNEVLRQFKKFRDNE